MLCHGKPLMCAKKSKNSIPSSEGNESEGEDMYGFLPKKTSSTRPRAVRCENIYEKNPRRPVRRVTFKEEPPRVRLIQRRHSCAENFRSFAARKYEYQPLIPIEQLPSYPSAPAARRLATSPPPTTIAYRESDYHHHHHPNHHHPGRGAPFLDVVDASTTVPRAPPPCYQVAVRRAASFSATRGVNHEYTVRRPPPPCPKFSATTTAPSPAPPQIPPPMPLLNRQFSSSTSDLYVDSLALKRNIQSRDVAADGSTSTLSEATVYRRVGPRDYVSVDDESRHKYFNMSIGGSSSSDDGVDLDSSSTDLENLDQSQTDTTGSDFQCNDSQRFSMANLGNTRNVDLDVMLVELCALESQCKDITNLSSQPTSNVMRTESPDNDSAFSDSVSLLSSESSTSSRTTPSTHNQVIARTEDSKAEKIELASQTMKEGNVKKLFIKVFNKDGEAKSLMIDDSMKCGFVTKLLADKHHMPVSPRWGLVEQLSELYMERVYEEHEPLVENLMMWTKHSKNKLFFVERPERSQLFQRPEIFHPEYNSISVMKGQSQSALVEEYLNNGDSFCIESHLYIKVDSKKGWKKYNATLRASGLYYYKEKTKSSGDLECLATFEVNQVYYGIGWKKKFKAPTEHCFAIKHPCLQQAKSTKYIKYLCAEDETTLHKWVTAIRIIKYGRQLLDNYQSQITDDRELSDSDSSGCDVAFESDFPCGTIKRKPPKLPLTATTRQLASLDRRASNATLLELPPPPPELLASTLTLTEEIIDLPPPPPPPRLLPPLNSDFATRLQRVLRSKWQVAQKCKLDTNITPHEALGFRDPPDYRETNVSNWVAEHYGSGQNLYANIHRTRDTPAMTQTSVTPARVPTVPVAKKRLPPPPPPPRSETTQLTTTSVKPRP